MLPVFRNEFAIPINAGGYVNASSLQVQTSYKCACHLRDLVKPYLLRRLKADVAHELPKKQEQVLFCQLSPYQRDLYEWILESDVIKSVLAGKRHILSGIDLLRKLCNHPGLLGLTEGLEDWPGFPEPYGEVSGKLTVVGETLRLWKERGHRVLLFCQTRQMLDFVEEYICEHPTGYNYLRMDGNTAVKERGKLVDRFNADQNIHVFLLTTKVGGLGLNLVGADRVLIYDPDWNPSTDLQARERAWRLGQTRPVTIYRLITAGTIEEKVYHRQIFKQYLTNRVLNDPKQSRFFKSSDLYDLFSLAPPQEHTGTETGELFSGLDLEIKRRLNASDRNGNAGEESGNPGGGDSHILESLFEMTGLHSALQHDQLVEKPRFEAILIEKEAARIAGEAAEALRRSREERLGQAIEKVTWTGNLRDLSKASSECMQRPMQPSSAPTLPSSASILAAIRRRNAPVLPASAELLDRPFAAILERLLLFFEENQGVCKSATIAERFRDVLEPGQEAAFRHLLRTIAVFDRIGKAWRLKPDLLQLN